MSRVTKFVDLLGKVEKKSFSIGGVALFDSLLIVIMFMMVSSRFIVSPGVGIMLGKEGFVLPEVNEGKLDSVRVDDSVTVLNVMGKGMIIFDGKIYNEENFGRDLRGQKRRGVLLIKADRGVGITNLLNICSIAEVAGYSRVQIAAKPNSH